MASEENTKGEEKSQGEEIDSSDLEEKCGAKDDIDEMEAEKGEEREENRIEEVGSEGMEEKVHGEGNVDVGEEEEVKEKEQGKGGEEHGKGNGAEEGGREEKEEVKKEKKRQRKGSRKESENEELSSPRTPGTERPTRERKTVPRFTVSGTGRGSAAKPMTIEKGRGTQLKDIPNVAFKLSKRKADENLHLLHTILYGKKTKVHTLKKNIGLFSGFVWAENEEKQKIKVKERLDKCVKEKLLDFCDVLNIPVARAALKKEELSAKLLTFLESPHVTTNVLLAEEDKSKKRKSKDSASKTPASTEMNAGKSGKKLKSDTKSGKKQKHFNEEEENEEDNRKSESSQSENDQDDDNVTDGAGNDQDQVKSEDGPDEELGEPEKDMDLDESSSKKSAKKDAGNKTIEKLESVTKIPVQKASGTSGKSHKKPSSSNPEKGVAEGISKSKIKKPLSKKQRVNKKTEEASTPAKNTSSSKGKVRKFSTTSEQKDQGKGKSSKNSRNEPTKEEMLSVVTDILKEVDFNTATLSDILRQLGKHFEVDLMHRKSEIKEIITEVINNMSDDEDEAEESGEDAGKDIEDDDA